MPAVHSRFIDALDALNDNIVILDACGSILFTNRSWRKFARKNPCADGTLPRYIAVGSNYLNVCRAAAQADPDTFGDICHGIEAVLEGARRDYSLTYPCHSPQKDRWFEMNVRPLTHAIPREVLIVHTDITQRRLSELEAQRKQSELSAALANLSGLAGRIKSSLDQNLKTAELAHSFSPRQEASIHVQHQLDSLSTREMEVLRGLAQGQRQASIAAALKLSPKSISTYRSRILNKLNLNSDAELIAFLTRNGQL
ncbi:MAG: PAS domain-containing protein [Dechloromonas sp.]|jgi:DNA-binding CsgD family transcriptional regulator|nr:PAS domain-containing protein [Dechloromonas sp.]